MIYTHTASISQIEFLSLLRQLSAQLRGKSTNFHKLDWCLWLLPIGTWDDETSIFGGE